MSCTVFLAAMWVGRRSSFMANRWLRSVRCLLLSASWLVASVSWAQPDDWHRFDHLDVLGTSLTISVLGPAEEARAIASKVLATIDNLAAELSHYDGQSSISQINRGANVLPTDIVAVLEQCEHWQQEFPFGFSCKLGRVIDLWQRAEKEQKMPERAAVRALARDALNSRYGLQQLKQGAANNDYQWALGGIAKGYIVDRAMAEARGLASSRVQAIAVDIGGDAAYWQQPDADAWQVGLAIPNTVDDGGHSRLGTKVIRNAAIAYSGHDSRRLTIGNRSFSHILAPRDGWPRYHPLTAVVVAPSATEADALATALTTLDIHRSLDWLNSHGQYAALLIDDKGHQFASDNWHQSYQPEQQQAEPLATIEFRLPKLRVSNYRKPYVALWIENPQRQPVKTLMLLGDSERWMSENRHWWRTQGRQSPELLLQGFARATRRAGEYTVQWDGRDDYGKGLQAGNYRLVIEAAREHGGHERLALDFKLGQSGKTWSVAGQSEIAQLGITLRESVAAMTQ